VVLEALREVGGQPAVGLTELVGGFELKDSDPEFVLLIDRGVPRLDFLSNKAKLARDFFGEIGLRGPKVDIGIDEVR